MVEDKTNNGFNKQAKLGLTIPIYPFIVDHRARQWSF